MLTLPISHWDTGRVVKKQQRGECFRAILVMDFEATCARNVRVRCPEIIEFPSVLLDARSLQKLDDFWEFVKPVEQLFPTLSPGRLTKFCTQLTHIRQDQVDDADVLPVVLQKFQTWIDQCGFSNNEVLPITCGDWDLKTMLPKECARKKLHVPEVLRKWCNIKELFEETIGIKAVDITTMLGALGLSFSGHLHSGMDDSRNIVRVVQQLSAICNVDCYSSNHCMQHWKTPVHVCWQEHAKRLRSWQCQNRYQHTA